MKIIKKRILVLSDPNTDIDGDHPSMRFDEQRYIDDGIIESIIETKSDDNLTFTKEIHFNSFENFARYNADRLSSVDYELELAKAKYLAQHNMSLTEIYMILVD
jgi:hypothetical protein